MSRNNEYSLKQVIDELLNYYQLRSKLNETKIIQSWEKVCGSLINRHTENIFISNAKLYVKVDSAALRNELSYARSKLVISLNKTVGIDVIEDIIFI